jgi:hypothetical protein
MLYVKPIIIITLSWFPSVDNPCLDHNDSQTIVAPQEIYKPDIYSTQDYIDHNNSKLLEIIIKQENEIDAR